MYRSIDLRQYQYYVNPEWSGMHVYPKSLFPRILTSPRKAVFMLALG